MAELRGVLRWTLIDGAAPQPGVSYTVLTAHKITGRFQRLEPPAGTLPEDWRVRYEPGAVSIVYLGQGR